MNERERLIGLLMQGELEASKQGIFNCSWSKRKAEIIADFLIGNGVKLFPCEIGDTVYYHKTLCDGKYTLVIEEDTVKRFLIYSIETLAMISFNHALSCDDFGKTVFLTREEAEKALKERD